MNELKKDWTHKNVRITDIRKLSNLYVVTVDDAKVDRPLLISRRIFEERALPYFIADSMRSVTRQDLLDLEWNFYITKGYYVKAQDGELVKHTDKTDENKWYVSFLEISGPLDDFSALLKKNL